MSDRNLSVVQVLPALGAGGVERGTIEVAVALVHRGHHAVVISGGGPGVQVLHEAGAEHFTLPVGAKTPLVLRHIPRLRRLIAAADIVHARSRLPAWICHFALDGLPPHARPVFVTSVHGPYTVNAYSRIMTRGEVVIATSHFIRDYILENYPDAREERIIVIPRGVDPARFPYSYRPLPAWLAKWEREQPQIGGRFLVTLPARITRWKGQEDFLQVLAGLLGKGIDVHGLLVGGAEPRRRRFLRELEGQARAAGLAERVSFLGHRDDLREIMSISDIVFSLSREPEAFGRTSLEALSLGVPVIAYNHGGAGEVLGAIFPAGKVPPADIAAAVARAEAFSRQRPVVPDTNPFTLQRMLDATIAVYESACAQRRPAS